MAILEDNSIHVTALIPQVCTNTSDNIDVMYNDARLWATQLIGDYTSKLNSILSELQYKYINMFFSGIPIVTTKVPCVPSVLWPLLAQRLCWIRSIGGDRSLTPDLKVPGPLTSCKYKLVWHTYVYIYIYYISIFIFFLYGQRQHVEIKKKSPFSWPNK